MKRDCIIITGSSGLIGSALARRLEAQYEVICFDREGAPHPPAECACVNCDLTSDKSVQRLCGEFEHITATALLR